MKGYQYAFNVAILTLLFGMFAGEIWEESTAHIGLHIFSKLVFSISLIAYSVPVLLSLYREGD